MITGPIVLVEDDVDDQEFICEALKALQVTNEVIIFENGQKALDYLNLTTQKPFLIISDVNLPVMNGLQLKTKIFASEYLRSKSIPFIFLSTSADIRAVNQAYDLSVQGFFVKESSYDKIKEQLSMIVNYWSLCKHPNPFEPL